MQKLDGAMEEVKGWTEGAEVKMDVMDRQGPSDAALKVRLGSTSCAERGHFLSRSAHRWLFAGCEKLFQLMYA